MASIHRRESIRRDAAGRARRAVSYQVKYRDAAGAQHSETFRRQIDAERRKAQIELALSDGNWHDPRRGDITLADWATVWLPSRHDLRATTKARLITTMNRQVLPRFGVVQLRKISNGQVRAWVAEMLQQSLSPATVRKAVFALRQCLEAAVEDRRIAFNPAEKVPLPSERAKTPQFLSQAEVEKLVAVMPERYRALVLVGAYGGLRWGEAVGLTRGKVDVLRSRLVVDSTAVEVSGVVTLGHEPKTRRSIRVVPLARSVMARIEEHLDRFVGPGAEDLVFTTNRGGPLYRGTFGHHIWRPAVRQVGKAGFTFHGLRHSFVSILVAAGCNVREVSEWAGHNSVAFTLTRYGGLFPDGSDAAVERLDRLIGQGVRSPNVPESDCG